MTQGQHVVARLVPSPAGTGYGPFLSLLEFLLPHLARMGHFPHPAPLLHLDSLILEGVSKTLAKSVVLRKAPKALQSLT